MFCGLLAPTNTTKLIVRDTHTLQPRKTNRDAMADVARPYGLAEVSLTSNSRREQSGGLIPDEHRFRVAAARHKRIELANQRLNARISSLESLATQSTLLAGFSYGTLTRDDPLSLTLSWWSEVTISILAALSLGASLWVVYLSGYAAIHARIAFLMGSDRRAVDDAILVLRETHERARDSFDLSMSTLLLCACALVCTNLQWYTSTLVIAVFVGLFVDGAAFKNHVDGRLNRWTSLYAMEGPPPWWDPLLARALNPAAAACWAWLRPFLPAAAAAAPPPRNEPAEPAEPRAQAPSAPEASRVRPSAQTPTRPRALRGWVYKTPSSQGPLRRPPSRPTHRRFLVLRGQRLEIFASQDRADLSPAYAPSRVIELAEYAVRSVHAEEPYTLALQPKEGEEAALSWYLRLGDRSSFAEWEARLRLACQPAQQPAEDDEESDTSSSSEEGDDHGDDADGRDGAPRAAREEERTGPGNPFLHPVLTSLMQCIPDPQARERRGAAPLV